MSFIYIMTNPAYPGYVKIGATQRDVELRRKELSSQTGVKELIENKLKNLTSTEKKIK